MNSTRDGTRSDYVFFNRPAPSRAERIARLDALASLLDTAIVIPGTNVRFGLDALIGIVPGIGDAVTTLLSLYIVSEARALGAPRHLVLRMLGNVAVDGLFGVVPLAGDVFDVMWRANRRNMKLLRDWLERDERKARGRVEIVEPQR
jgi:hypothetical protein